MACYYPITAYRSRSGDRSNGKWPIVFKARDGYVDMPVVIPCGQCIGCRLERSRQWAMRCVHEASLHKHNCFVTLTYNDEHLPQHNTLVKRHVTLFLKRLRKAYGSGIRFYMCGEYGDINARPHYHILLFNHDFSDKRLHRISNKNPLYTSESLLALWPYGYHLIGNVSFESAAYVARYILKKRTGKTAAQHYINRIPEYTNMSRMPGIGKNWLDTYQDDVYPHDYVIFRKRKMRPPKYYDSLFEKREPYKMSVLKVRRKYRKRDEKEFSYDRLRIKEEIQHLKLKKLPRTL